jgi:tetratricopeptide (TPR) repeat protein
LPDDPDFVAKVLPQLVAAGRQADADRLFDETWAVYERICRTYPRSSRHHNSLAWLAARCDRRLDAALLHAQEALRLEPNKPAFLDTLAEAHSRRGEREEALALEANAVQLEPANKHFQKQLHRFRNGD